MKVRNIHIDALHLVRFAAILWIGYLAILAIINQSLWDPRQVNANTLYYYYLLGIVAFICLGLTYWTYAQRKLGRTFLPMLIAIITVFPILATWGIIQLFPRTPILDPQGSVLRLIPFFLVSFILVAWQYNWLYMLLIILATMGLNVAIVWSFPSPGPFQGALTATLIQTVIFLAVGFSISFLIGRLKKQQQSLEAANAHLTHYASTLEQLATSRERNRLARELHDTLAHTLSGLSVQLETIKAYWDVDPKMARSSLDKSLEVAHSGLEETRRALKSLRASPLEDLGLTQAIKALAESQGARANLTLNLAITDRLPALSSAVEQCVYRVVQEAIANVINHAKAKNLSIKLAKENPVSHFGLTGMRERAQLVGGDLSIKSSPGQGTILQLTI